MRDPIKDPVMKDDLVAFRCTSPAVGVVLRVGAGQTWVDVRWLPGMSESSGRYKRDELMLVNPILSKFVMERQ